jgi:hypothetical protein
MLRAVRRKIKQDNPDKIKGQMVLSIILTIVLVVVIIKLFGPVLLDLLSWLWGILTLPFALLGGFIGFLIEALLFVGLLWLIVTLFGL